jgi:serine O-acetyltransferase
MRWRIRIESPRAHIVRISWRRCSALIASDLWRHAGKAGSGTFCSRFIAVPGFRYATLLRLYAYARSAPLCQVGIRQLLVLLLRHYSIRFGIDISRDARIGSGFYIGHFGGIVVNAGVVIGNNCNLSQGVTIGQQNRGERAGCPVVGNNVYIAPGAKIIGRVQVGDDVAIGANAVVVHDVAPHTTVGGVPARVISQNGSEGYVNRTDYPAVPPA